MAVKLMATLANGDVLIYIHIHVCIYEQEKADY